MLSSTFLHLDLARARAATGHAAVLPSVTTKSRRRMRVALRPLPRGSCHAMDERYHASSVPSVTIHARCAAGADCTVKSETPVTLVAACVVRSQASWGKKVNGMAQGITALIKARRTNSLRPCVFIDGHTALQKSTNNRAQPAAVGRSAHLRPGSAIEIRLAATDTVTMPAYQSALLEAPCPICFPCKLGHEGKESIRLA